MSVIEKAVAILRAKQPEDDVKDATEICESDFVYNEVESDSRDEVICQLDFDALSEAGYITGSEINARLVEEYRAIKRPLLTHAFGKGAEDVDMGNMVMITSALKGEGKTFTAINLALSIAIERDTTVLLIDIDVLNPNLSRLFGLAEQPGLLDVVNDPAVTLSDVIVNTDNPKLRLIPAGISHEHSTEILASERMGEICREIAERYPDRIVLFDAPPYLNTTQAKVMTKYMGQVLVIVEAGTTNKAAIIETTEQLRGDKVVGLVLNKSKVSRDSVYGGNYGTYGE